MQTRLDDHHAFKRDRWVDGPAAPRLSRQACPPPSCLCLSLANGYQAKPVSLLPPLAHRQARLLYASTTLSPLL